MILESLSWVKALLTFNKTFIINANRIVYHENMKTKDLFYYLNGINFRED